MQLETLDPHTQNKQKHKVRSNSKTSKKSITDKLVTDVNKRNDCVHLIETCAD